MPTQKLTQNSFTSGQYDRAVQGKEQSELVASGLAKAMNVVSSESGELRKRLGTKFLMELDENAVVVPFRLPSGDDIMLLCGDKTMKAYQFAGDGITPYMTPDENAPVFPDSGWTSNTNGDYTVKLSSITSPSEWGAGFNMAASPYYGKGSLFKIENTVQNIPAYIEIDSTETQILESLRVRWVNSCNGDYKGHYKGWIDPVLQYSDDGESWVSVETDSKNPFSGDPDVYQASKFRTESKKTESMTLMEVVNVKHNTPHKYWRVWFMNRIQNTMTYSGERLEVFVSNVAYVSKTMKEFVKDTVFGGESLKKIKYSQDYTTLMIVAEDKEPLKVSYSAGGLSAEPFKSLSGDGYAAPASVSFFQNRLWFAGVAGFPTTVLGSKFGDYDEYQYSLTIASGAQYDDALNLKSNQLRSKIKNIVGSQNVLYCFSEDGISFVDGGGNGVIATNQSIEFNLKNRMPAGDATPTFKDDVLLYASADGTKLYAVDYDMVVERFQVEDIARYAKDVVTDKITELHYVNNESKLVYGLMESNIMFSLLYDKKAFSGFFPMSIQNGYVTDICPVKRGRDYRLVLVTSRSGRWFLEEKLDKGKFVSTDNLLMTAEDKKWSTYDNLENNIALDCYKTYENAECGDIKIEENVATTNIDLSNYVGQIVVFAEENSKDFLQAEIQSVTPYTMYAWVMAGDDLETGYILYTSTANPKPGDGLFDKNEIKRYTVNGSLGSFSLQCSPVDWNPDFPVSFTTFVRHETKDYIKRETVINKVAQRGTGSLYTKALLPFDAIKTHFGANVDVGVISQGRYLGEFTTDENKNILLPFPVHKVIYGATYESYGIIKVQKPYESMKSVQQINVSVINTAHLQVGTRFDDLQELEKIKDDSHYDLTNITMNGSYRIVPSDTPEWDKYIILRSVKGLPFTVVGVEAFVNYSNTGGN